LRFIAAMAAATLRRRSSVRALGTRPPQMKSSSKGAFGGSNRNRGVPRLGSCRRGRGAFIGQHTLAGAAAATGTASSGAVGAGLTGARDRGPGLHSWLRAERAARIRRGRAGGRLRFPSPAEKLRFRGRAGGRVWRGVSRLGNPDEGARTSSRRCVWKGTMAAVRGRMEAGARPNNHGGKLSYAAIGMLFRG